MSHVADVFWVVGDMKNRLKILAVTQLTHRELVLCDTSLGWIPLIGELSFAYVTYDFVESLLFLDFVSLERGLIVQ